MSENALIPLGELGITTGENNSDLFTNASYLCRVALMTSQSKLSQEGKVAAGNYAYIVDAETFQDLGSSIEVLVVAMRAKALDVSGAEPVENFQQGSDIFEDIKARSGTKDSGCMFGPEYLFYIPEIKKFALYFCGSKTGRRIAPEIQTKIGNAMRMEAKLVENKKKQRWHAPVVKPCSTPLEIPEMEELKTQVKKFQNPQSDERELAPETEASDRER